MFTMLSTNWYQLFYWVTRADSIRDLFDTFSNIFTFFTVIFFLGFIITFFIGRNLENGNIEISDKEQKSLHHWRKMLRWTFSIFAFLMVITWTAYVAVPSKKDALLIIAAGGGMEFLTTDSTAKQLPGEITTFVLTELKTLSKEAQVDLGIATQKDKILEEAKKMTSEQVMERMRIDSNFAKIIMEK